MKEGDKSKCLTPFWIVEMELTPRAFFTTIVAFAMFDLGQSNFNLSLLISEIKLWNQMKKNGKFC